MVRDGAVTQKLTVTSGCGQLGQNGRATDKEAK